MKRYILVDDDEGMIHAENDHLSTIHKDALCSLPEIPEDAKLFIYEIKQEMEVIFNDKITEDKA